MKSWVHYLLIAALSGGGTYAYHHYTAAPVTPPGPSPAPASTLLAKLQAAYDQDRSDAAFREAQKTMLMGIYAAMSTNAKDPGVKTLNDLLADLRALAGKMMAPGLLIEVRQVIAAETAASVGVDPNQTMDEPTRTKCAGWWKEVVETLKKVR